MREIWIAAGVLAGLSASGRAETAAASPTEAVHPFSFTSLIGVEIGATSELAGRKDRYAAWRAFDGNVKTAWCEGAKGDGAGAGVESVSGVPHESLAVTFGRAVELERIEVDAGMWSSDKLFAANNVPTKLSVFSNDRATKAVEVTTTGLRGKPTSIPLVSNGSELTIELAEARSGKGKSDDTCITDVRVFGKGDSQLVPVLGVTDADLAELTVVFDKLDAAFGRCDADVIAKHVAFPFTYKRSPDLGGPPVRFRTAADVVKACKAKKEMPRVVDWELAPNATTVAGDPTRVRIETANGLYGANWTFQRSKGVWRLIATE